MTVPPTQLVEHYVVMFAVHCVHYGVDPMTSYLVHPALLRSIVGLQIVVHCVVRSGVARWCVHPPSSWSRRAGVACTHLSVSSALAPSS